MGEIKVSPDYNWFRSTVPLKKVCMALLHLLFVKYCIVFVCGLDATP
jgi:hypothetical protein